jgi:hypothetical protein
MLIFRNPGLIDLEAVRTLGVSVKRAGSFGRFGTGLKFAIATILRGGGTISIYRGREGHTLSTINTEIRGETFQIVTLDGVSMGITTALGRDWEPWMVLRELGCNALDEGGSFGPPVESEADFNEEETVVGVAWDALDTAYLQRKELFLEGEPLWSSPRLRILSGPSAHIFYRGVRVYKLDKPAAFTYDILDEQRLTEDRTLVGIYGVDGIIRDTFLTMQDKTIIAQAITAGDNYHESKLDYEDASWGLKPSRAFLDAAVEARESNKLKNPSAKKVLLRHIRSSAEEKSTYGSYRRVKDDALTYALEQLTSIGITFDESVKFVFIDEMPGPDTLSMVEDGRIYLLQDMVDQGARVIAEQLIARWVDLKNDSYDAEGVVKLMIPILLGKLPDLKQDEALVSEDEEVAGIEVALLDSPNFGSVALDI